MQSIISALRCCDVRKARAVQGRHQEIAGAVSREDSARAIGSMRSRSKPDQQQSRVRIAETGHGQSPVRVETVCALLLRCNTPAVLSQPRTAFARHDCAMNLNE
jgi:hypothetical protein